ncbi:MAG: S8 family serine peptidase, partial [Bacteroidota bacterium]
MNRLSPFSVRTVFSIGIDFKKDRLLNEGSIPEHAVLSAGNVRLRVQSFSDVDPLLFESGLKSSGFQIQRIQHAAHFAVVDLSVTEVDRLCRLPFVKFVEPVSPSSEPEDTKGRSLHRSNVINQPVTFGRHFNGDSIAISLADDGEVGPHIDFTGRMIPMLNSGPGGNHGDMTSGIAVGAGNLDPTKTGMADGATLLVHDIDAGNDGYDHIYNCATYYNQYGAVITSTSYSQGCNDYNAITQTGDQLAVDNPQMTFVFSAGNRGTGDCNYGAGTPWGTITGGFKIGKNTIACANLDPFESLDNTSSRGPADDGRIKPDIAANGADQNSTDENNTYQVGGGTSAACPGIAGVSAQLYQAYRQLNNGQYPEGALIKAVLLNTAQDLGNEGPDFTYGYGRVNAYRAVRTLEDGRYIADSVSQSGSLNFPITIPSNTRILKVMLHWRDLPGDPAAAFQLVNDLDMEVTDGSGLSTRPLVLDPTPNAANLSAPAVPGIDRLNNTEQVVINNPVAGTYTVRVDGFLVPSGSQGFYITWDLVPNEILLTYPHGGESFVPGQTEQLRWDAVGLNGSFSLEYSQDGGVTWSAIAS